MSNTENDDLESILGELNEIKKADEDEWKNDIVKKTISSLLSIEKEALYGSLRTKSKRIDDVISEAIKENKE